MDVAVRVRPLVERNTLLLCETSSQLSLEVCNSPQRGRMDVSGADVHAARNRPPIVHYL